MASPDYLTTVTEGILDTTDPNATTLQEGGQRLNGHFHNFDAARYTNRTGSAAAVGDVVAIDDGNDSSVELNDVQTSLRRFVVAQDTAANTAAGEYARSGKILNVKATGSIARHEYVRKSATTKTIETTGITASTGAAPPNGTLGIALKAAAAGVVDVDWWGVPISGQLLYDQLSGLKMSNNGVDATNDVDVAIGACVSDDAVLADRVTMSLTAAITKRLDAAWAVGTNQGGRDTGAIANDVWHVFVIMRTDTGVVDVLFSVSLTPTMPTSYTKKRRIGSVIRVSAALLAFIQEGDYFRLKTPPLDINGSQTANTWTARALTVPTEVRVRAHVRLSNGTGDGIAIRPTDATDSATVSGSASPLIIGTWYVFAGVSGAGEAWCLTNTSAQIETNQSATTTLYGVTLGWVDDRGRG